MNMKITKRQREEIDFLMKFYGNGYKPTQDEIENYIRYTVNGIEGDKNNPLFKAKWTLDVMIKMWREDITIGLFSVKELKKDFNHPYFNRLVDSIVKSVTPEYRKEVFKKNDNMITRSAISNFPELRKQFDSVVDKLIDNLKRVL